MNSAIFFFILRGENLQNRLCLFWLLSASMFAVKWISSLGIRIDYVGRCRDRNAKITSWCLYFECRHMPRSLPKWSKRAFLFFDNSKCWMWVKSIRNVHRAPFSAAQQIDYLFFFFISLNYVRLWQSNMSHKWYPTISTFNLHLLTLWKCQLKYNIRNFGANY